MEKRKGVDLLIKGYLQYKNRGGKKKLILGGKMQEEEINQIVRSAMMLDEDITYLDYVTHDKKARAVCLNVSFCVSVEGRGVWYADY